MSNFSWPPSGVPLLGVGTMLWGTTLLDAWVNGKLLRPVEAEAIIRRAVVDHGIRFFDCAEGYGGGTCEEMLGAATHRMLDGLSPSEAAAVGPARNICLATKFLPFLYRWTSASVVRAIAASNRRLGVDCCELYFLHSPVHPLPLEVWVRGAATAYHRGMIRAFGLSNCDAAQVRRACALAKELGLPLVANQILFNLMVFRSAELQETLRACEECGVRVIGYSPLGQGLLAKPGLTAEQGRKIRLLRVTGVTFDQVAPLRACIANIAAQRNTASNDSDSGTTMAHVCLAWARSKGVMPLVGVRSVAQLDDAAGALSLQLTAAEVDALDRCALGQHTFGRRRARRAFFVGLISVLVTTYRLFAALQRLPLIGRFLGPRPTPVVSARHASKSE